MAFRVQAGGAAGPGRKPQARAIPVCVAELHSERLIPSPGLIAAVADVGTSCKRRVIHLEKVNVRLCVCGRVPGCVRARA